MSFLRSFGAKEVDLGKLGLNDELFDLLFDIGIYASTRSYFVHAEAIFLGYLTAKPESERAYVGLGLLSLARADYDLAIDIFKEKLLKQHPENDVARAYLGICLRGRNRLDEAKKELNAVLEADRDESAVALAKACLEQIEEKG